MVGSFVAGTFLGVVTVGAYTYRTMKVMGGQPALTLASSSLVSCTYWFSINFIVEDDIAGYLGFSVGAAIATTGLAWKKKKELASTARKQ
jgi:hypothetical protein